VEGKILPTDHTDPTPSIGKKANIPIIHIFYPIYILLLPLSLNSNRLIMGVLLFERLVGFAGIGNPCTPSRRRIEGPG
jgi:hypothetical protein